MTYEKLDITQYWTIRDHNARLIEAQESAIKKIEPMIKDPGNLWARNQLTYLRHCVSSLKWATCIARQRAGVPANDSAA